MDPGHKALLRKHRVYLSSELLVSDTVVPFLFQEQVLTAAQVEDVEAQTTNRMKTLRLLDLLPTRGPRAFDCFLQSLEDFSWVRDRLLLELQSPPGPGSTGTPVLHSSTQSPAKHCARVTSCLWPVGRWTHLSSD